MLLRDISYVYDIVQSARFALDHVRGYDEAAFRADRKTQSAAIMELLVIGEATKQLSGETRMAHPDIPWRSMAGMRDVLIHDYRETSLAIVWTAIQSLPGLISRLEATLPPEAHRPE